MPSIAHPDWPPELDHGPPDGLVGSVDLEHKNVLFVQSVRFYVGLLQSTTDGIKV